MAKSIRDEIKDLKDWAEILRERTKENLSGDMSNVKLLVLLIALFFVVLLGGLLISSSQSIYGPIFSNIIPASKPTPVPTALPVTATPVNTSKPSAVPTLVPVPITGNVSNNTTAITSPSPTSGPRLGWDYGTPVNGASSFSLAG